MEWEKNLYVKLIVIILALALPWVLIGIEGPLPSLSTYWMTEMQPAFIFVNAATSYLLFNTRRWEVPALCLLFVTAFSIDTHPFVHNVSAICFFLSVTIPFLYSKRFHYYSLVYACSIFFLFHSLLAAEIFATTVLCVYHTHVLIYYNCVKRKRNVLNQNNF